MVVTCEWIRLAFASLRSSEQTNLFPPSTAHRLVCAPASETAPGKEQQKMKAYVIYVMGKCVICWKQKFT